MPGSLLGQVGTYLASVFYHIWSSKLQRRLIPMYCGQQSSSRHAFKHVKGRQIADIVHSDIRSKLITGQIPLNTHILYLMMLHDVYE
jgi:hypothetical protein